MIGKTAITKQAREMKIPMDGKFHALLHSMKDQESSHKSTAFIIESLFLLIFVTASIAIVIQLLGAGYSQSMKADKLSTAVFLASNEAERFTADPVLKSQQIVYIQTEDGLEKIASNDLSNKKAVKYNGEKISLTAPNVYVLKRAVEEKKMTSGKLYNASIKVDCQGSEVYSLDTARYISTAATDENGLEDDYADDVDNANADNNGEEGVS